MKFSKTTLQNNLETVTNEHDQEIPKEIYNFRRKIENY